MSRLTDLIRQAKAKDAALGADLETEFRALSERRVFGLNFERHRPEAVELPQRSVRKGDKVRVLPPRGTTKRGDQRLWRITSIETADGGRVAHLALIGSVATDEVQAVSAEDLVVVAEFRDPIYPGLVSTGRVEHGGDKPFHTLINAENFHALQTLLYTHRGNVDVIYIDPPYNSGAKDWKYNNDYVDGEDLYRHSKWLAFMERRLQLAKELLNGDDSVLIVTIDEKEYARLGLLLEQVFPEANTQMISSVISPSGAARNRQFTRVNEFIFFVMLGAAAPAKTPDDMLFTETRTETQNRSPIWNSLRRLGAGPRRSDSHSKFYPVLVEPTTGEIMGSAEALPLGIDRSSYTVPRGMEAVWPTMTNGEDGRWELARKTFQGRLGAGQVRAVERSGSSGWNIQYLRNAQVERLASGEILSNGMSPTGYLLLDYSPDKKRVLYAKTVWNKPSHDSRTYGSWVLRSLIPQRRFPFPKSLYAVEDSLRFFVKDKPEAIIVDFFSGSGTTAHAVMRLNRQDGGRRSSISVTNNEVSAAEQTALRKKRLRPGDPDWEENGICDHISKPRLTAAITGETPSGEPIKGEYKFTDEFPMSQGFEENIEFFTLTYETPWRVARHRAFAAIAPLLWMRAGSRGRRIGSLPDGWDVADTYGVLEDLDRTATFLEHVAKTDTIRLAFIVTDDDRRFQMVCAALPDRVDPVRLYESYLRNFEINSGRE